MKSQLVADAHKARSAATDSKSNDAVGAAQSIVIGIATGAAGRVSDPMPPPSDVGASSAAVRPSAGGAPAGMSGSLPPGGTVACGDVPFTHGLSEMMSAVRGLSAPLSVASQACAYWLLDGRTFESSHESALLPVEQAVSYLSGDPIRVLVGIRGVILASILDYVYRSSVAPFDQMCWYEYLMKYTIRLGKKRSSGSGAPDLPGGSDEEEDADEHANNESAERSAASVTFAAGADASAATDSDRTYPLDDRHPRAATHRVQLRDRQAVVSLLGKRLPNEQKLLSDQPDDPNQSTDREYFASRVMIAFFPFRTLADFGSTAADSPASALGTVYSSNAVASAADAPNVTAAVAVAAAAAAAAPAHAGVSNHQPSVSSIRNAVSGAVSSAETSSASAAVSSNGVAAMSDTSSFSIDDADDDDDGDRRSSRMAVDRDEMATIGAAPVRVASVGDHLDHKHSVPAATAGAIPALSQSASIVPAVVPESASVRRSVAAVSYWQYFVFRRVSIHANPIARSFLRNHQRWFDDDILVDEDDLPLEGLESVCAPSSDPCRAWY